MVAEDIIERDSAGHAHLSYLHLTGCGHCEATLKRVVRQVIDADAKKKGATKKKGGGRR